MRHRQRTALRYYLSAQFVEHWELLLRNNCDNKWILFGTLTLTLQRHNRLATMNLQRPNSYRVNATSPIKSSSASENIRERLNLHLKRRIQVQEKSTLSSSSSCSSLSPPQHRLTINPEHLQPQNLSVESNPCITSGTTTILLTNSSTVAPRSNLKGPKKMKSAKKPLPTKKISPLPSHVMHTQNGNQISVYSAQMRRDSAGVNDKLSERKSTTTLIEINTLPSGATATMTTTTLNESSSPPPPSTPTPDSKSANQNYEKFENKTAYSSDILSMVLNEKKNRLMHDPEIMRFLANVHMNFFVNRANR